MTRFSRSSQTIFVTLLRNPLWQIPLFGGLAFLSLFYLSYSAIDSQFYQVRDDGIITMSHAKNLVDYGFIGVGPSGDRVEGYSAPVQFFVYAVAYYLTGLDYKTYSVFQTIICSFLLGVIFSLFFRESRFHALGLTFLAGLALSKHTAFIQWHGSGMENPITHLLIIATLLILYSSYKTEKITYLFAPIVFCATISRIDGVYHLAPLLIIFAGTWRYTFKNYKGFIFASLVFLLWLSYHLWRYSYFGDWVPNTAYAQNISIGDRLKNLLSLNGDYVKESIQLSKSIFFYHGGYLLLVFSPLLLLLRRDKSAVFLFSLLLSLVLTALLNPFWFGQTRLDPVRSTTHLAMVVILAIALMIYYLKDKRPPIWIVPAFLLVGLIFFKINNIPSYDMCCKISHFDSFRKQFAELAKKESLPRPTISNPDLGVMSWHKQFNIIDLGRLGTPIMAKLENGPILSDYFFDYAAPDMIESHDYWSCQYEESIFGDPRFRAMYLPIRENRGKPHAFCNERPQLNGVWIRKDILDEARSPERHLIDDLRVELSVDRLRHELEACQASPQTNCVYIARTAFRFLPEFRDRGKIGALNEVFSTSRTKEYDLFLVNGYQDPQAHLGAMAFIASQNREKGSRVINQ